MRVTSPTVMQHGHAHRADSIGGCRDRREQRNEPDDEQPHAAIAGALERLGDVGRGPEVAA